MQLDSVGTLFCFSISVTTDHIKQKVRQFYVHDDISQQAPVVIKEDGVKKTYQKKHLTMSILEAESFRKSTQRSK